MRTSERIALTGMIILGFAALAAGRYVAGSVEERALSDAQGALERLQLNDVVVRANGLNLEASGRVATSGQRDEAVAALRQVSGSARLIDNIMVIEPLVDLRPAILRLQRDETSITLTGEAPNTEARDLLEARIDRAAAGLTVLNLMKTQDRRASNDWLSAAEAAIDAVLSLSVANASVERGVLTIEGAAADASTKAEVLEGLRRRVRAGFELDASVSSPPPFLSPYVFSVRKSRGALELENCAAPTPAQQSEILTALLERGVNGADGEACPVANGAPNDRWSAAAARLLTTLDQLTEGEARLVDDAAAVIGFVADDAQVAAARTAAELGWPEGFTAQVDIRKTLPIVSPFAMTVVKRPGDARLAGATPSLGRAEAWAVKMDATNQLELARGEPENWIEAVDALVEIMADLKIGAAWVEDYAVRVAAPGDDSARAQLRSRLQSRLPRQYRVTVEVAKAPRSEMTDPDSMVEETVAVAAMPEDKTAYVFVARKGVDGSAAISGLAGDETSQKTIATYARAKLGGDAMGLELEVGEIAPPIGWQRAVFAALDAVAELDTGEAVVEPGALYLRGRVSRAADAARAVAAAREKASDAFAQFSWITVREDATALAAEVAAQERVSPDQCVAEANAVVAQRALDFEVGEATLSEQSLATVETIAFALNRCPGALIEIAGHTDNQGADDANLTLSRQRAFRVRFALIGAGVDAKRLDSEGYGAERPIADNDTKEGRARNRRIEFLLRGDASP